MDRQEEAELLSQLRGHAERIATAFGLDYRAIVAEHPRVKSRYGACYSDGLIAIRLRHAKTGRPLKYSSLIDTLCHELAHLRHFNHGPQFKAFFFELLGWARRQGIYCPRTAGQTPELGTFVPSEEALAAALQPPRRNGVPVFPLYPTTATNEQAELPWERRMATPAPARRPAPTPLATHHAPNNAARGPTRAAGTAPRRDPPRQLSLF